MHVTSQGSALFVALPRPVSGQEFAEAKRTQPVIESARYSGNLDTCSW